MHFFTGVGSRNINSGGIHSIKEICSFLNNLDEKFILRSGRAMGSDYHFEMNSEYFHIYLPWEGFNNRVSSQNNSDRSYFDMPFMEYKNNLERLYLRRELVKKVIPWWDNLKQSHKKLHFRNVYQVMGHQENVILSSFLIYWAPIKNEEVVGGTRTAVKLAEMFDIPTFNLKYMDVEDVKKEIVKIIS